MVPPNKLDSNCNISLNYESSDNSDFSFTNCVFIILLLHHMCSTLTNIFHVISQKLTHKNTSLVSVSVLLFLFSQLVDILHLRYINILSAVILHPSVLVFFTCLDAFFVHCVRMCVLMKHLSNTNQKQDAQRDIKFGRLVCIYIVTSLSKQNFP